MDAEQELTNRHYKIGDLTDKLNAQYAARIADAELVAHLQERIKGLEGQVTALGVRIKELKDEIYELRS